ncbi:MAG: hypothetical protein LUG26_01615 [Ruminococcus sp.]|nr:hypothetical protein [Ruminococcus sp.]
MDLIDEYPDLAYEADNLDGAIESLISDMNNDIASEFSSQFNRLETDEDVAALQNYEDAVLELGQVVGTTEFSIDIDTEIDGMENLWSAMKESVSATELTADSVEELTNRYKDLDNFDAASLFEKTSNGIHLNTKALRELESAYEEQKKSDINGTLEDLVSQYNDLTKEINNCSDAATTAELYSQRADILEQIEDTYALAAEYEGLTSAFNKWEEAQSIGEEGDMHDSLAEGLENIKELYDEGLIGTNKFRAAVQLMSNEDLSTASIDELLAAYESGYSTMTRYFSDSSDGCLNFLNDLQELNSEWVSMNEDGSWDINFGMGNDQEIADALGINVESVQSILKKLSDYGFEINLDSIYSNLDLLKSYAEEANDSLKELGKTDYTFNFETDDIDYVNEQIEVAQTLLYEFKNEDGTVNLGLEGAKEAQTVLISLISQKQSLSAPAVMSVDTTALSNINPDLAAAIATLQEFVQYTNDLEIEIKTGADTADTQTKLQEVSGKLNSLSEETKIAIGIDGEEFSAALQSIANTDVNVEAGVNINQEDIDSVQAAINGIDVEDITMTTNADSITSELTAIDEYTIDNKNFVVTVSDYATIKLTSINSYLSTLPTSKTIVVTTKTQTVGSGSAQGTAYASGSWGTKSSGVGLGGELGEGLVRLYPDILFNCWDILKLIRLQRSHKI